MWLLLVIVFTGPTSPDAILYQKFATQEACETAWVTTWRTWRPHSNHVCIPVGTNG